MAVDPRPGSVTPLVPARRADVAEIAGMSRELVERGLAWRWTPHRVGASLRRHDSLAVVARDGVQVAGFGIMRYRDDDAHLDLLAVRPDARRRGLGRRLIEWLEKPALVAGITEVWLEVRERNLAARAFYERLGYREVGRLPRYYDGRESAIRMRRELAAKPTVLFRVDLDC